MRRAVWTLAVLCSLLSAPAQAAVQNGSFTVSWNPPTDPRLVYEFKWRSFADGNWQLLPDQDPRALSFIHTFSPLPAIPATDRWLCVDARSKLGDQLGTWLSETATGAACNTVEVGTVVLPPPPPPIVPPPTPPQPPPPTELFSNLKNSAGVLSFDYRTADCPRGVSKITGPAKNGIRIVTLTCLK